MYPNDAEIRMQWEPTGWPMKKDGSPEIKTILIYICITTHIYICILHIFTYIYNKWYARLAPSVFLKDNNGS